ncbi:hypothetical protein EN839_34435, partial [Mesorhizobium sp. M1C.F.Ca.ET.196.01.1.1]
GSASDRRSSEVSALTQSILNSERRIAALARQGGMMRELRHSLDAVFDENADSDSPAAVESARQTGAGRG